MVDGPDQIVLSGAVSIHRGEVVGEVVVLHGSAEIAGVATGDVVVLDGRIVVTGQVSGSAVSVDGSIQLGPNSHVLGDAIARDRVVVADGALVDGSVRPETSFTFRAPIDVFGPFATWLAVMASALLLGLLLMWLAPRGSEAVADAASGSPVASALLGLGLAIVVPVVGMLAVVSVVVWPLGLAMVLAAWFLASLGFAWGTFALGRRLWGPPRSRWLAFAFGWLALAALAAIPFVGGVVWALAAIDGVGAAMLAMWRARRADANTPPAAIGGRHRAGGRMPEHESRPLVREAAMEEDGTGI
jgi:hypothetical protein